jgi:hypothetical protein
MSNTVLQLGLALNLDEKPAPAPAVWERVLGSLGKIDTVHIHKPTGWTVRHCGHPTANFPYYIETPDGRRVLAPNGRGFQRLELAKKHTEENNARR